MDKKIKTKFHTLDLTAGNIPEGMVKFAVPVFLGTLFQLFYSLADTRIVGSFLGEGALASVGAVSVLANLMIGFMNGMALGFAIPVARYFGSGNRQGIRKNVGNIISLGAGMTVVFTVFSLIFMDSLMEWMNVAPKLYGDAKVYISILICGMAATFAYNAGAGILRAVGDTLAPLLFLVCSSVLNIVMDLCFITVFHMGVEGAAYATVLAQITSALLCWVYMMKKYEMFHITSGDLVPEKQYMGELASAGFSMACMNSLVQFGTVSLQTSINTLGQDIIVAHTAARKATEIFMILFSVIGSTMATFAGQNYGAGSFDRIRKGLVFAIKVNVAWCLLVFLFSHLSSPWVISLITGTKRAEILNTGSLYLKVDTCFYLIPAFITMLRNMLQGIGDHITPVVSSTLELGGKVIFAKMLTPILGYWGIIWAEPAVWAIMVIPLAVQTLRHPALKREV
ncbi:MAG: MATE family efflux transporter [Lachnospiraceae bacterium]|nr:MATE family efflux transporter [Lachnospiraceae bacterium]MDE6981738.1 MATE family efflux transporter [Lachnospiraceae bacterium]